MIRKSAVPIVSLAVAVVWLSAGLQAVRPAQGSSPRTPAAQGLSAALRETALQPKAIVDKYCAGCHNERTNRTALDVAMGVAPVGGRPPFDYRDPTAKDTTAVILRDLMTAKGVKIEPYAKP